LYVFTNTIVQMSITTNTNVRTNIILLQGIYNYISEPMKAKYDCWNTLIRINSGVIVGRRHHENKPTTLIIGVVKGFTNDKVIVEVDGMHGDYDSSALEII